MNMKLKSLVDSALEKRVIEIEELKGYKFKKPSTTAICDCDGDGECCSE